MMNRRLIGTIISDAMQQTAVVLVERVKLHPRYHKQYSVRTKFKAHNPENQFHTGDLVEIAETRPLSRHKRWIVVRKIEAGIGNKESGAVPQEDAV
ncbi:MAG: 30S ribosomal protein S17 [Candidatus Kerfeldbacteria bacterium]|nr:30S ribosomal protein S17 [Candidatus Kerfeldbacteria bacterium]